MPNDVILKVTDMHVAYGAIEAIKGISLEVRRGEIVSLIGANGAGKTTTLHAITGLLKPSSGALEFKNAALECINLCKIAPHLIVTKGLAHVPEGRHVFKQMTVSENLLMGAFYRNDAKKEIDADLDIVYTRFPRLKERSKQLAGTLSGGEQQMLAMGRAMMSRPELVVMDEPSMGLSPLLVSEVFNIIGMMHDAGITVLLVEQNAKKALSVADRAYVLETGIITMEGNARDLLNDERVKKAYLGA